MGLACLTAVALAGCVMVVHQPVPDPFTLRVSKDGTEILLRQGYPKVKAAMESLVPPNLLRHGFPLEAGTNTHFRVNESVVGEACRVRLDEGGINSASWHFTVVEARRIADGLTQVRAKGERGRVNFILPGSTRKRDPEAERGRLTQLIQITGW